MTLSVELLPCSYESVRILIVKEPSGQAQVIVGKGIGKEGIQDMFMGVDREGGRTAECHGLLGIIQGLAVPFVIMVIVWAYQEVPGRIAEY